MVHNADSLGEVVAFSGVTNLLGAEAVVMFEGLSVRALDKQVIVFHSVSKSFLVFP